MNRRELAGLLRHDDGRRMTADEARDVLLDEIAKGHKVIPCGTCDNFDYQDGCMGHPSKKMESAEGPEKGK